MLDPANMLNMSERQVEKIVSKRECQGLKKYF